MPDTFTEYSHTGFGRRVGNSIKGMIVGGIMFIASFPLLAWNEGRSVKEANSLEEGKKVVVSIDAAKESPQTEGMLVFTSGKATTDEELEDPEFGVSHVGIKLKRTVEMYQWEEDKDTDEDRNGNKKTTYKYEKKWSEKEISSSGFRIQEGHQNPKTMPFHSATQQAQEVMLGVHMLSQGLIDQITEYSGMPLNQDALDAAPEVEGKEVKLGGGGLYYGRNASIPEIGDVRVVFSLLPPQNVSVVARQAKSTFGPYQTKAGNTIELLEPGLHDANYVFTKALDRNATMTWILRAVGWFCMFLGLCLMLGPLTTVANAIPIFGSVVGLGVGLAAFVLASVLSLVTIAVAWIFVRPIAAVTLLVVCGAMIWGAKKRGDKKIASGGVTASAPPPPPPPPAPTA